MIRFLEDITLDTTSEYDENLGNNNVDILFVDFKKGDLVEGQIISEDDGDWVDIKFNDGSVAINVLKENVEEID
jgi:hypothetical protein